MTGRPDVWGLDRLADLAELVDHCMPAERLSRDELQTCCWDDPGVVLGGPEGGGAMSACMRREGDKEIGYLKLLVVESARRRRGFGTELISAAEEWAFDLGADEIRVGGSAPFYLWPGVDVRWTSALALFETLEYQSRGAELNMSCPTTFRSQPADTVAIERVLGETDEAAVLGLCREHWPNWLAEVESGIESGCCFAARSDGALVGFAAHSVNRSGWVGPIGTDPAHQGRGIGSALMSGVCRDLEAAGYADAQISWLGPVAFYAKACGASVSRVFRSYVLPRDLAAGLSRRP